MLKWMYVNIYACDFVDDIYKVVRGRTHRKVNFYFLWEMFSPTFGGNAKRVHQSIAREGVGYWKCFSLYQQRIIMNTEIDWKSRVQLNKCENCS